MTEVNQPRSRWRAIAVNALLLIAVLAVIEAAFRFMFPVPKVLNFDRINYSRIIPALTDQDLPSMSNASFYWHSQPDDVSALVELNLYGFRDNDWTVEKNRTRVALVGDSFVEGMGAPQSETIAEGFRIAARETGANIEVMNAGIAGVNFPEYIKLIRDFVPIFQPDYLVLVLFENDFPPEDVDLETFANPIQPEFRQWYIPRIYYCFSQIASGKRLATRWRSEPFDYVPPAPHPGNPWTRRANTWKRNVSRYIPSDIREAMAQGKANLHWVQEYVTLEERLKEPFNIDPHIQAIADYCANHGTQLLVCYIPNRHQVTDAYIESASEYSKKKAEEVSILTPEYKQQPNAIAASCAKKNIPYLDFSDSIQEREDNGIRCYLDYDDHMRGETYLFLGNELYEFMADLIR